MIHSSWRARPVAALALVSVLAGCGLPRTGPTKSEIFAGSEQRGGNAFIVEVNDRVARATSTLPGLGFGQGFLNAGVIGSDTIQPGDTLGLTIWENVEDGLLAQQGANSSVLSEVQVDGDGFIFVPYAGRVRAADITRKNGSPTRIGPFAVPKAMSSTVSATLATHFKIKGVNFSISSACTTSLHCIGAAAEQIQWGKQDVMFAGGGEELDWTLACRFDAMGAMSSKFIDTPQKASRAFDVDRDGFVISGGGGIVVLEELEHALARGAKIYAEVTGYGATSDGHDMVAPSGEGGERAMRVALETLPEGRAVSYINAHGTSPPVGDVGEIEAVRRVFGQGTTPPVSSTKSMTGHAQGAAGALEAIFSLLMLEHDFVAPSINVETLDEALNAAEIATTLRMDAGLDCVMTNSFGFGGTNGSMILSKFHG